MAFGQLRAVLIVWFTATFYAGYQPVVALASVAPPNGGTFPTPTNPVQTDATSIGVDNGPDDQDVNNGLSDQQKITTGDVAAAAEDVTPESSSSFFPMPSQTAQTTIQRGILGGATNDLVNMLQQSDTMATAQATTVQRHRQNPTKEEQILHAKNRFTLVLMLLTGIQEAICFRRFGSMPTMMTGNTIRGMVALTDRDWALASISIVSVLCYISGGALFRSLSVMLSRKQLQERQNPSSSSKIHVRHLPWVSRIAMVLCLVADGMHQITKNPLALLPAMSIAYGMINVAAMHETGAVTNAITGHYSTAGLGFAEHILFRSQYSNVIPSNTPKDKFQISTKCSAAFVLSLLVTAMAHRWLIAQQQRHWILSLCPPFATTFGLAYLVLLNWYDRVTTDSGVDSNGGEVQTTQSRIGKITAWRRKHLAAL